MAAYNNLLHTQQVDLLVLCLLHSLTKNTQYITTCTSLITHHKFIPLKVTKNKFTRAYFINSIFSYLILLSYIYIHLHLLTNTPFICILGTINSSSCYHAAFSDYILTTKDTSHVKASSAGEQRDVTTDDPSTSTVIPR